MQVHAKGLLGMFEQKSSVQPGVWIRKQDGTESRFRAISLHELGPTGATSVMPEIVLLGKRSGFRPLSLDIANDFTNDVASGFYAHPQGQAWITLAVEDPDHPFVPLYSSTIIVNRRYNGESKPKRYDPKTFPAWHAMCEREFFIFEKAFTPS